MDLQPKWSHALKFQITRVFLLFQPDIVVWSTVFYTGKLYTGCTSIAQNVGWNTSVLSDDNVAILPFNAIYLQLKGSHLLYFQFRGDSSCSFNKLLFYGQLYFTQVNYIQCALILRRMCVETQVFYTITSKQSFHIQHWTIYQNVAMHSIFNLQEFHSAFSTRYCSIINCILHGLTIYGVRLHCAERGLKHKCFYDYIEAILPYTALNHLPKCSHELYVQNTRVSCCFFNPIL